MGLGFADVSLNSAVVIAGQRMELECRRGGKLANFVWMFFSYINRTEHFRICYSSRDEEMICPGLGHYVDRNSSGVLYSNATKMENAGIYLCEAEFRETYEKQSIFAILVVFG